jgi:hypothetical protein
MPRRSVVDWLPDRHAAVEVDAAEDHVGEVVAEANGSGLGQFGDELEAEPGGSYVVVVKGVLPQRVGDLDEGVESVAEAANPRTPLP